MFTSYPFRTSVGLAWRFAFPVTLTGLFVLCGIAAKAYCMTDHDPKSENVITVNIANNQLVYSPGQSITFNGTVKTPSGQGVPGVQIGVDDVFACRLGPQTDPDGNFTFTTTVPPDAWGAYTLTFYSADISPVYVTIAVSRGTLPDMIRVFDPASYFHLGKTSNLQNLDLSLMKKTTSGGANTTIPPTSTQDLLSALESFNERSVEIANEDIQNNPASHTGWLQAAAETCDQRVGYNGVGLMACPLTHVWAIKAYGKDLLKARIKTGIEYTGMSPDNQAIWKTVVDFEGAVLGLAVAVPKAAIDPVGAIESVPFDAISLG